MEVRSTIIQVSANGVVMAVSCHRDGRSKFRNPTRTPESDSGSGRGRTLCPPPSFVIGCCAVDYSTLRFQLAMFQ